MKKNSMKKNFLIQKLSLKKVTLNLLNRGQLNTIVGGEALTNSCNADDKHMPTSPVICK